VRRAGEFEELRPLLFSIAYRILGSVSEAEDAVQETWLRYAASPAQPASAKAFLSAVVTRISINVLRSARHRREEYVGPWFPEPLADRPRLGPCGLRPGPCLRLGPAAFAGDSRLGCLLTTVSWLRSLNEHTCLAPDHEAAAQRAAVRDRSHAGDPRGTRCCPEASSNRSPPSSSALRKA
jgi:RNA polymerase sigma-70 factor (ECF subfamily)